MEDNDLPMFSNIDKYRVRHYLFKYDLDMNTNYFTNETILIISATSELEKIEFSKAALLKTEMVSVGNEVTSTAFSEVILDCCNLNIIKAYEIFSDDVKVLEYINSHMNWKIDGFSYWKGQSQHECKYKVNKWSLHIYIKPSLKKFILLRIVTSLEKSGRSVNWRKDQDGNTCLFTAGSQINNRSIMPSQDHPLAMATWEATFHVPNYYYVSCTGDKPPVIISSNSLCYYYNTTMPMPTATFALAIGKWQHKEIIPINLIEKLNKNSLTYLNQDTLQCNHQPYMCNLKARDSGPLLPISVVAPLSIIDKAMNILSYCNNILMACYYVLGNHPLCRMQFVILPRSFNCLGLTSPNVIFISSSLLYEDSNTFINLAHELSHTWFGILIGPKNWNEEWLTEGFAAYLETHIYLQSLKVTSNCNLNYLRSYHIDHISEEIQNELIELRGCIKYLKLINEETSSPKELQTLSPPADYTSAAINALDTCKDFLQVHYIKGYFLLQHLSNTVGKNFFLNFLKLYISKFHGCLVTSADFFTFFYEEFPQVKGIITYESIIDNWLSNPKVNEATKILGKVNKHNSLITNVLEHLNSIKTANVQLSPPSSELIFSDQLVLLLEFILKEEILSKSTLKFVYSFYKISQQNAEIKHRWCELIIKHNYQQTQDIEAFLIENQSMGVYLYGEMIISGDAALVKLAKDIFSYLKQELDPSSRDIISEMLFAS